MIRYGQRIFYDGGSCGIDGCRTPDEALWACARMVREPKKALRKSSLTEDQIKTLIRIAKLKLFSTQYQS